LHSIIFFHHSLIAVCGCISHISLRCAIASEETDREYGVELRHTSQIEYNAHGAFDVVRPDLESRLTHTPERVSDLEKKHW